MPPGNGASQTTPSISNPDEDSCLQAIAMVAFGVREVVVICVCYVGYAVAYRIWSAIRFSKFAKARGCEDALNLSGRWPGSLISGLAQLPRVANIVRSGGDILDDFFAPDFASANTVSRTSFEGSTVIATTEPANIQAMLATQFKEYEVGQRRFNQFYPLLGYSIFTSDGSFWEHSRALFRPQFSREQINDLDSTDLACVTLVEAIGPADISGWTSVTELQPLLYNFTLDTASDFLFGESVESQRAAMKAVGSKKTASRQFGKDFEIANVYMLGRIRFQSMYWFSDGLEFRRACRRIRAFTEQFVQRAINPSAVEKGEGRKYNLLSALATQTQDRTELRNQTLAILVAGRDTTAALLGWCIVRLSLHPKILAKLRSIILTDFDSREPITFAKLKGCRFLQHYLNEVLRLHSTVPLNNRFAAQDTTLPVGGGADQRSPIALRKGQTIVFSVYVMHRRKDLWGDDALEFKPERWEQKIPAWQFLPFSGGPRICLGQQYALTEASYVLVKLLSHYDGIEPADPAEMRKMRKGLGLTMWPADQCRVRFHKA